MLILEVSAGQIFKDLTDSGLPCATTTIGPPISVTYSRALTAAEQTLANAIIARYATIRKPRLLINILNDIQALTSAQKSAIEIDIISGTPAKWTLNMGINEGASLAVYIQLLAVPTPPNLVQIVRLTLAALYAQMNWTYLLNPSWAPTIAIDGSEPL